MSNINTLADNFVFLESPRWHQGQLWVSDLGGCKIYKLDESGNRTLVADVPERPSGLTFLADGRLVAVSRGDNKLCIVGEDGSLTEYADVSSLAKANINDSVIDANGNIFVGSSGYDPSTGEEAKPGNLIKVDKDGNASIVADGLSFPNGMVITDDGNTLVCAETDNGLLTAFTLGADGSLSDRRIWADLGEHSPDGICMDTAGAIWVASIRSSVFIRVVEGGEITDSVEVPNKFAVACNLGGVDGKTLYMMTYEGGLEQLLAHEPNARIETYNVAVPASGSP